MLDNRRGDCEGLVGMCVPEVLYSTHTVAAPLNVKLSSTRIRKPAVQVRQWGKSLSYGYGYEIQGKLPSLRGGSSLVKAQSTGSHFTFHFKRRRLLPPGLRLR